MPAKVRSPHGRDPANDIIRDLADACELSITAEATGRESAMQLLVERASGLLRTAGYQVSPGRINADPPRGDEPAFRIETSADYAVRDVRLTAGIARSRAEAGGRTLHS